MIIPIKERAWTIEIDVTGLPHDLIQRLKELGVYALKTYDVTIRTAVVTVRIPFSTLEGVKLSLPKGQLGQAVKMLAYGGFQATYARRPVPQPRLDVIIQAYANPKRLVDPDAPAEVRLEPLQVESITSALKKGRGGVIEYAMGGGKSLLIAAVLKAYPDLRPAVVTSASSADGQQLAASLAVTTGERIKLLGCDSGKLTALQKRTLFTKGDDADIFVATHNLFSGGEDAWTQAKLMILDEVHECCTVKRMTGLMTSQPALIFGATATWLKNWSGGDKIMADLIAEDRNPLVRVEHQEVEDTGRITPMEVHCYELDRVRFPHGAREKRSWGLMQQEVDHNEGRNRFLALLCDYLIDLNEREGRGVILAFAKTIGHARNVAIELCKLRNIPYSEEDMYLDKIAVFNSQIANTDKTRLLGEMTAKNIRIMFSTDTLARGIDIPGIHDTVDLSGQMQVALSIQKSGRAVRPDGEEKVARMHIVLDDSSQPMLKAVSIKKREALERYYNRKAIVHRSDALPFDHLEHQDPSLWE